MSKKSKNLIAGGIEVIPHQERLHDIPGYHFGELSASVHPYIHRDVEGLKKVLSLPDEYKGIDLEFNARDLRPTIVSVTTPTFISTVRWSSEVAQILREDFQKSQTQWVAHSGVSADRPVVEKALDIKTPLNSWEDSMITHYLCNQHLCLRGDTRVLIPGEKESRSIESLVTSKYKGPVYSHINGRVEIRYVKNVFRNKRNGRKFYELSYENAPRNRRSVVTGDHKILTSEGWKQAQTLTGGEYIYTGTWAPNKEQDTTLTGILLGDSHVDNNRLVIMHEAKQEEWLRLKASWFPGLFSSEHKTETNIIHIASGTSPFHKELLIAKRKEFRERVFDARSLAVWYLDDGSWNKGFPIISCTSWSAETRRWALEQILKLGIPCSIRKWARRSGDLYFGASGREALLNVISKYVPDCMLYKIGGTRQAKYVPCVSNTKSLDYIAAVKIRPTKPRINNGYEGDKTVYCLEIENADNFVTAGGVVSNCKAPSKEDSDDAGALGFMNLWTAISLETDMYHYKNCRQVACDGPCPDHDPDGYCGVDSWGGVYAFLGHREKMKRRNISWSLYRESVELAEICHEMEQQGIRVDVALVQEMSQDFEKQKAALFPDNTPFNPKSNAQVMKWFGENAGYLALKSNEKKEIFRALEKQAKRLGYESVQDLALTENELSPEVDALYRLYEHKEAGKGFDAWFAPKYLDKNNFTHPRFVNVGTATGRLSSSRPNYQNIPRRGFGDLVRRAIIPLEGYDILKSDSKQLELRVALHQSGESSGVIGADAFVWLVEESKGQFLAAAEYADPKGYKENPQKAARDTAKTVSYASLYLAGFKLYSPHELESARLKREIERGALRVYQKKYMPRLKRDWMYCGKVVCFTGSRLAELLFKDKSLESRAKALKIQEDVYYERFFKLREWQMKILEEVESKSATSTPIGRYVKLYGNHEDRAKAATSVHGQGIGADHIQAIMLRYKRERGIIPLLQVHDELVFQVPREWSDDKAREFLSFMGEETWRIPGFVVPADSKRGPNWKDLREL